MQVVAVDNEVIVFTGRIARSVFVSFKGSVGDAEVVGIGVVFSVGFECWHRFLSVYSLSCSSDSKIESNFIDISPSFIDRFSASMSSSVRCGGFSIALMRRCAAAFFPFSVIPFTCLSF